MTPDTLDLMLRGGACLILLLLAGLLVRDHAGSAAARLGAFFALGTAGFAIASAAGLQGHLGLWGLPLVFLAAGNNVVLWLFACALFDDGFRPRPWHGALWLGVVAVGSACGLVAGQAQPALADAMRFVQILLSLGFAGLAVGQTLASWRADLVEPRRRLRLFIVGASALYVVAVAIANLLGDGPGASPAMSLAGGIGLAVIAGGVAWSLLSAGRSAALFPVAAAGPAPEAAPAPAQPTPLDAADRQSAAALERAMAAERLYRQEGLTIGGLAEHLGLQEYRLRRLINQGLGYRNFNAFLNHYRIAETKAALADPAQEAVSVLTIALDAGFGSLGPFNRAFKAETGLTPTEYRRLSGAESGGIRADSGIGEAVSKSA